MYSAKVYAFIVNYLQERALKSCILLLNPLHSFIVICHTRENLNKYCLNQEDSMTKTPVGPQAPVQIEEKMTAFWMKFNEKLTLIKYIHMT